MIGRDSGRPGHGSGSSCSRRSSWPEQRGCRAGGGSNPDYRRGLTQYLLVVRWLNYELNSLKGVGAAPKGRARSPRCAPCPRSRPVGLGSCPSGRLPRAALWRSAPTGPSPRVPRRAPCGRASTPRRSPPCRLGLRDARQEKRRRVSERRSRSSRRAQARAEAPAAGLARARTVTARMRAGTRRAGACARRLEREVPNADQPRHGDPHRARASS